MFKIRTVALVQGVERWEAVSVLKPELISFYPQKLYECLVALAHKAVTDAIPRERLTVKLEINDVEQTKWKPTLFDECWETALCTVVLPGIEVKSKPGEG